LLGNEEFGLRDYLKAEFTRLEQKMDDVDKRAEARHAAHETGLRLAVEAGRARGLMLVSILAVTVAGFVGVSAFFVHAH
jgi:hypothetical protein